MYFFDELEKYKKNLCVIKDNKSFSYKDLIDLSKKIAQDIPARSIVLVLCNNSFEFIAGYVGFLRSKSISILIDANIRNDALLEIVNLYKPNYIFSPTKKIIKKYILKKKKNFFICKTNFVNQNTKIDKNLCLLLSTSGSMGSSKLVRISYINLESNTRSIAKYLKISKKDRLITTLNPSYTYGFSQINSHLAKGASIVLNNHSFFEKKFWELIKLKKPNNFGGVPFSYEILKKIKLGEKNIKSIKYITQAGGKLSKELHNWMNDICKSNNIKFFVMYGATEATSRMSYLDWKYSRKKVGSIGRPIPGGKMWLIDKNKKKIYKNNLQGRLVYKGKNVTMGYAYKYSDLFKKDENKNVLITGDLAYRDSQNFYYITGREKRFIKIFGYRLNLEEIENKLNIKNINCACTGIDNYIKIFIENKKKINAVKKYFSKELSINPKYYKIYLINKIPRNNNGKILYNRLNK